MNKKRKRGRSRKKKDEDEMSIENEEESEGLYESAESYESEEEDVKDSTDKTTQTNGQIKETPNKKVVNLWDEKNRKNLKPNEELVFDNEAYEMLHRCKVEWPCLSVDFLLRENSDLTSFVKSYSKGMDKDLIKSKDKYPYDAYVIAGAQTNDVSGFVYFMKWYNMKRTKYDDDSEKGNSSENEDEEIDDENTGNKMSVNKKINPLMRFEKIPVGGNVNRIKSMRNSPIVAYWTDEPSVNICDCSELFEYVETNEEIICEQEELGNNNKKKKAKKINLSKFNVSKFKMREEG